MKALLTWLVALLLRRRAPAPYIEHCRCHDLPVEDCPQEDL